ncbi:unnamed protein product [Blepharisma stoltei]|uniref:Uncharacterized protein n=1 Tax=Blepharisma stoltei TaxID=1481888 RepID=A0AAU9J6H1_9CILI|nr:unnamed protein product [Blepharisma stoltei]
MNARLSVISEISEAREISNPPSRSNTLNGALLHKDGKFPDFFRSAMSDSLGLPIKKFDSGLDTSVMESFCSDISQRPETDLDKLINSKIIPRGKCSCACAIY